MPGKPKFKVGDFVCWSKEHSIVMNGYNCISIVTEVNEEISIECYAYRYLVISLHHIDKKFITGPVYSVRVGKICFDYERHLSFWKGRS